MPGEVEGLEEVLRALRRLGARAPAVIQEAIVAEAYRVDAESVKQVPVDTGRLRSTHTVVEREGVKSVGAIVTYGGGSGVGGEVHYARDVHDNLRARYRVGKARFLADPFEAAKRGFVDRIVSFVSRKLGL